MLLSNPADTSTLPRDRKDETEVTLGKSYTQKFPAKKFPSPGRAKVSLKKSFTQSFHINFTLEFLCTQTGSITREIPCEHRFLLI